MPPSRRAQLVHIEDCSSRMVFFIDGRHAWNVCQVSELGRDVAISIRPNERFEVPIRAVQRQKKPSVAAGRFRWTQRGTIENVV